MASFLAVVSSWCFLSCAVLLFSPHYPTPGKGPRGHCETHIPGSGMGLEGGAFRARSSVSLSTLWITASHTSLDVQTMSLSFPVQSLCSFSFPRMCFHQRPAWFSFSLPSAFHSGSPDLEDKRVGSSFFSVPHQFCEQCEESHGVFSFVSCIYVLPTGL